jgi:hypothetical protein
MQTGWFKEVRVKDLMTGGMLPQYFDTIAIIDLCSARGKPVVVGGPAFIRL